MDVPKEDLVEMIIVAAVQHLAMRDLARQIDRIGSRSTLSEVDTAAQAASTDASGSGTHTSRET